MDEELWVDDGRSYGVNHNTTKQIVKSFQLLYSWEVKTLLYGVIKIINYELNYGKHFFRSHKLLN